MSNELAPMHDMELSKENTLTDAVGEIKGLMHEARSTLATEVNQILLQAN